jgi:hypothetical protein
LGENVNTIQKNKHALFVAGKDVGLRHKCSENYAYIHASSPECRTKHNIKIGNKLRFEVSKAVSLRIKSHGIQHSVTGLVVCSASGLTSAFKDEHIMFLQNITNTNPVKNPRKPESSPII